MVQRETAVAMLRRFARQRDAAEQCEFCSVALAPGHRHLLEVAARKIICACDPCALRFESAVGRFKLIPRDARALPAFQITDEQWEALALPINLAFFFRSTPAGRVVALYPSPAGPTESLLPLASWEALAAANPMLARLEPDVEALLANRLGTAREYYLAPIDACFELVGLIRLHWRGFSGGEKVWQELENFFAKLRAQTPASAPAPGIPGEVSHA
jgi:hypothetical protein